MWALSRHLQLPTVRFTGDRFCHGQDLFTMTTLEIRREGVGQIGFVPYQRSRFRRGRPHQRTISLQVHATAGGFVLADPCPFTQNETADQVHAALADGRVIAACLRNATAGLVADGTAKRVAALYEAVYTELEQDERTPALAMLAAGYRESVADLVTAARAASAFAQK